MILGDMLESTLQQTLVSEGGNLMVFFQRPIAASILCFGAIFMAQASRHVDVVCTHDPGAEINLD